MLCLPVPNWSVDPTNLENLANALATNIPSIFTKFARMPHAIASGLEVFTFDYSPLESL